MIRKMLENKGFKMTDEEFSEVMKATTDDIKFNGIKFNHRTNITQMLTIAEISYAVLKKAA